MLSASDLDRPTADGPVGQFLTHGPVGPDRILSTCDPDRPVADSPVGRFLKFGPVDPRRMFSLDELNLPVAVGPVGHPFTPGPVGTHAMVSDDKRMDRRDDSPVGSTGIVDPVNQTGSPIQSDFMKIGTINGPASSGDTPPSSDSGVHSLGEQWEISIDIESEQNERPSYGNTTRRRVSDTSVPPNTEEGEDIDYPWTDRLLEREYTSGLGLVGDPMRPYDAISVYTMMNENFKGGVNNVMLRNKDPVDSRYHQWCVDNKHEMGTRASVNNKPIRVKGRFGCLYSPVRDADWPDVRSVDLSPVGDVWIEYIGDEFYQSQSTDAAPLTELQDLYTLLHIYSDCATGFTSIWTFCVTVQDIICGEEFTRCGGDLSVCQTMDGAALVDDRSGVTFTAELCIPWDAPEAVIDIDSADLVSLGSFPDKVGLFGRRKDAAVSCILAGRDSRSVRFLVPDGRVVDCGYHDVTVVDMEDEREPMVVMKDMTRLRELWPVEVFDHMKWYQQDLELMRKSAKKEYSQTRPMPCRFCGKVIRVDMYRHVARLHLNLVQLWRCPIAWCTTWKGSPQDCLEHLRSGHDAPWISKTASIEKYAPPWTVRRELWKDSLRVEHSGISTDMLLFSEVGMSLTQHYQVYKGGLPHAVFRTDYMDRLRSLLRSPGQSGSPPETGRASTPKSVRRLHRSSQAKRLFPEAGDDGPFLTVQNPAEMVGETVIDCRPSVLPVSIPLSGLSPDTRYQGRGSV